MYISANDIKSDVDMYKLNPTTNLQNQFVVLADTLEDDDEVMVVTSDRKRSAMEHQICALETKEAF